MPQTLGESTERILYSIEEAARLLGIGRSTAYTLVRRGQLGSVRIGRRRLIPHESIEQYTRRLPRTGPKADGDG